MRPQQQNRRMRGRNNNNNNNRKGPNPLTRNYESNGPDVKIRGSAQQIAEKYATLARDAMSSGDRVMAENYLQHAEHYNRIIAAAQAQMPIQHVQQNRDEFDDDMDEDRDEFEGGSAMGESQQHMAGNGSGPQPVIEGTPAEVALNAESGRDNGGNGNGGRHRDRRHNNGNDRGNYERNGNGPRRDYGQQPRPAESSGQGEPATAEATGQVEAVSAPQLGLGPAELAAQAELRETAPPNEEGEAPRRARRPRRPRVAQGEGSEGESAASLASAEGDGGEAGAAPEPAES